jgi:hypothetical protein
VAVHIYSFLLSLLSPFAFAAEPSYGELGKARILIAWKSVEGEMAVLNKNTFPHEAKDVRKLIANLREQIDLFVYAYPKGDEDLWFKIRDDLDEGYEKIGFFKDLFDIQELEDPADAEYKKEEVKERRQEVLDWKKSWEKKSEQYHRYLQEPLLNEISTRKKKDLSRFYWGSSELVPDLRLSGSENLAALSRDLLKLAEKNWKSVKEIKNPADSHELEEEFHDFRKRLRSVVRIIRTTKEIYSGSEADLANLEDVVGRYGDINDKIVARLKAEEQGQEKRSERLLKEIGELWSELLTLQSDIGIKSILKRVQESIAAGQ